MKCYCKKKEFSGEVELSNFLNISNPIFCDIIPCSPLKVNQHFGGIGRLHLQGRRISHHEEGGDMFLRNVG
jgi:hypothetical protein